ncbi:MAG: FtsX-like permease family protein [Deltaproteobacteria bacterium]|nr:FtsX-like permease family protein [Deltaproteobacteria bacterium]
MNIPIARKNVFQNKKRAAAAVSGIAFSVLLVFMQLGFLQGARTAAGALFDRFNYDLGIVSERYKFMGAPDRFDKMRLTQAQVLPEIESWVNLNISNGWWKDPDTELTSELMVFGITLDQGFIRDPEIRSGVEKIQKNNTVLVDVYSHPGYGDLTVGREVEVNEKTVTITGQFKLGVSLFSDGCVIMSNDNFFRLTRIDPRKLNYGFLRVREGADPEAVKEKLKRILPDDVLVFTREEMINQEQDYFISVKPVGVIFQTGVVVAFIVGVVILFQVLNTDISNRLNEFATLKAMGFNSGFIYGIGVKQALMYALMSYFPALGLAYVVFHVVHALSKMPMDLTPGMALFVFSMSLIMCIISCILGLQKVRRTDPAELY